MAQEQDTRGGRGETGGTPIAKDLDALSLAAALRDFEVANARVIDLMQRLIHANESLNDARKETGALREELRALTTRHEAMQGSAAFRIASKIWALRNLLRA